MQVNNIIYVKAPIKLYASFDFFKRNKITKIPTQCKLK